MTERTLVPPQPIAVPTLLARAPDRRLMRHAARGSTPAFATIYQRHHQEIYRYCRSLLGNDEDASDALQNTMLRALRGLPGERRDIALRPWLFRVAHNEAVSLMRVRARTTALSPDDVARLTGADDFETRERLSALVADLRQLTEHQRGALMMRELSGLGFDEIAAALGTSREGAKQAVYQARISLSDLAAGRDMSCDEIRRRVSVDDRRLLRGRRVRAHLRECRDCREFENQIRNRSRSLAVVAPPLPAAAATIVLKGVIGGGSAGGTGAAGGGIAVLLTTGAGLKAGATVAATLALGAGVYVANPARDSGRSVEARHAGTSTTPGSDRPGREIAADSGWRGTASGDLRGASAGPHRSGGDANRGWSAEGPSRAAATAASAPDASPPAHTSVEAVAAEAVASPGPETTPSGPESTSPAEAGTPPGQGGIPPGQGGTPPGQAGTPPGQGGIPPGQGGIPPGQGGTPPGQAETPPGQAGTPPGHGGVPPGHGGTPPGQTAVPSG